MDDVPQGNDRGWTPDRYADRLREPLAAIGARVRKQCGRAYTSGRPGFQAAGFSARAYEAKLEQVEEIVDGILRGGPA